MRLAEAARRAFRKVRTRSRSRPPTRRATPGPRRPTAGRSTPRRRRPRSRRSPAIRATTTRRPSRSRRARPAARFACKLRRTQRSLPCVSPKAYPGLADGPHTFVVKATDPAGNTSAETSYAWTVDTAAPTTQITVKPNDPSNSNTPSFSFTASEGWEQLRLQARRWSVRALLVAEGFLEPARAGSTHLQRESDRRGRQSRDRDQLQLDDRHDGADDDDHRRSRAN